MSVPRICQSCKKGTSSSDVDPFSMPCCKTPATAKSIDITAKALAADLFEFPWEPELFLQAKQMVKCGYGDQVIARFVI